MRPNNICCIVIGDYIGVPACCVIALKCPEVRVTVVDNEEVVSALNSEISVLCDSEMEQIIKKCRNRNLFFSSDHSSIIREADLIFISINISSKATGTAERMAINLSQLEDKLKLIAANTESDAIVVENSKVLVNATERISALLPSPHQTGVRYHVISNPDFLTEGSTLKDLLQPELVLIGCQNNPGSRAAAQTLCELYELWIPRKNIFILNHRSAEICKVARSAFLTQRISNMNSLLEICEHTEADISKISEVLGKDSRMGSKLLYSSAAFRSFQREILTLVSLCESLNLIESANYWQTIADMNEYYKMKCFRKIETIIGTLKDKEIAIWGFSYEKNTCNTNNSPAIEVCLWLLTEKARIKIYDPQIPTQQILKDLDLNTEKESSKNVEICSDAYQASENTSAIIICTDCDEFTDLDYSKVAQEMKVPLIIDGKKFLEEETMKNFGIDFHALRLNYVNEKFY